MTTYRALFLALACLLALIAVAAAWSRTVIYDSQYDHVLQRHYDSPDGSKTLVPLDDRVVTLRDLGPGKKTSWGLGITCRAVSPDGKTLAAGTLGAELWVVDVESGRRRDLEEPWWLGYTSVEYPGHVAFSPDGKTLAAVVNDRVGLWDVASGKHTATMELGFGSMTITADGRLVALREGGKRVKILVAPALATWLGALFILSVIYLLVRAFIRLTGERAADSLVIVGGPPSPAQQRTLRGDSACLLRVSRTGVGIAILVLAILLVATARSW